MTAVTVAPFMDANALLAMISKILETSLGQWSYESDCIRFGFGTWRANYSGEGCMRNTEVPESKDNCEAPCKPLLVYSVLLTYKVIVWMDVDYFQERDLRLILNGVSVGTSYFCIPYDTRVLSSSKSNQAVLNEINAASLQFFVMIVDIRFYNRVLMPWKQCASNQ